MGLVQELKEKVNGLVVEFQNKVAEALETHEAATSEPAGEGPVAPGEEQVPDAQDKANEPTQIPVTDGNEDDQVHTTDSAVPENEGNPAVVTPKPETVDTAGPAPTTEGDPNIVL